MGCNDPGGVGDLTGMGDLERAVRDLAAARAYPETVRREWVAEYRSLLNGATVVAVVVILLALVVAL